MLLLRPIKLEYHIIMLLNEKRNNNLHELKARKVDDGLQYYISEVQVFHFYQGSTGKFILALYKYAKVKELNPSNAFPH